MTTPPVSYAGELHSRSNSCDDYEKSEQYRKHRVKLLLLQITKRLLFTVDGVEDQRYTLFVFDLEGRLITQTAIQNRETSILPEIAGQVPTCMKCWPMIQRVENRSIES